MPLDCPTLNPAPFVVGVPRSGTTLLRLMLDSHPDLAIPQETHFLPSLILVDLGHSTFLRQYSVTGPLEQASQPREYHSGLLRDLVYGAIVTSAFWEDFDIPASQLLERMRSIEPFVVAEGIRCFYQLYADRHGKSRWGDKTPVYGVFMRAIEELLPEAHFIHIVRDVRDVAVSHKERKRWKLGRDVERLAEFWEALVRETRSQGATVQHFKEVRYEDLLRNSEQVLEAVCDFLNIPFAAQMRAFHLLAPGRLSELRDSHDPGGAVRISRLDKLDNHLRVCEPLDLSRIGRWKQLLSISESKSIERIAGKMLERYGYDLST